MNILGPAGGRNKNMKTDFSKKTGPLLTIIGVVCVVILMAMIIQSLIRFFNPPPETRVEESAVTAKADETVARQEEETSPSAAGEHPFVHPVSEPASTPPATSQLQPALPQKSTDFNTDSQKIQEREKGRQETIENMRKTIKAGNLDSNEVIQQEKKLKEIEDSGASFM